MCGRRAARISRAGEIGVNPDQRIHADVQHLADLNTDLGIGLFQASILLASFIGVLWGLSRGVVLPFGDAGIVIPGYMVWAALLYALGGSLLSWRVGRPLVQLETSRYAREADLRTALVRAAEQTDGIVLSDGEADARTAAGRRARPGARSAAPHRHGQGPVDLGDGRLRLAGAGGADPGGGTRLFRR